MRKSKQFARHHLVEPVEARNAVTQRGDGADLVDLHLRIVVRDLLAKNLRNLVCLDLSHLQVPCSSQFSVHSLQLPIEGCSIESWKLSLLTTKNRFLRSVR